MRQEVGHLAIPEGAGFRKRIDFGAAIDRLDREATFSIAEDVLEDCRKRVIARLASDPPDDKPETW